MTIHIAVPTTYFSFFTSNLRLFLFLNDSIIKNDALKAKIYYLNLKFIYKWYGQAVEKYIAEKYAEVLKMQV